jgi:preprotein translocase subunit SecA
MLQYATKTIPKWTNSAILVHYDNKRDDQYTVKNNDIKVVDKNTGVI